MEELIQIAIQVRENAYAPYSKYKVGAALKTKLGKIYTGCNVENSGIMSICAERVAFTKAISEGETEFDCIMVVGGKDSLENSIPCGYCRQFMNEFVEEDFKIYTYNGEIKEFSLKELLPNSFKM